jgi:transposase
MSVVPQPWPQPAPQLAEAVAAMYRGKRERPLPVLVRDKLGEWLADEQFAGAYGTRGKPGWPPGRLALVTVLQMAEDLTDRQAAAAVRTRIDWKYALGLDLADPGFDDSVLSEFRGKVAEHGLEQVVLDTLLERLAAGGLVGAGRHDAHRFHPRDLGGTGPEPAGAGRRVGAGLPGAAGGGRAAGGGAAAG